MSKINWSEDETLKLISIWSDFKSQLESARSKKQLFLEMAAKLREDGVDRSGSQIQIRIANLKYQYGKINKGTANLPNNWVFYHAVHAILHNNQPSSTDLTCNSFESESPPIPPVDVLLEVQESSECSNASIEHSPRPESAAVNGDTPKQQENPILRRLINRGKRKRVDNIDMVTKQGQEIIKLLGTLTTQSKRICDQLEAEHKEVISELKHMSATFTDLVNCAKDSIRQPRVYIPSECGPSVMYDVHDENSDNQQ